MAAHGRCNQMNSVYMVVEEVKNKCLGGSRVRSPWLKSRIIVTIDLPFQMMLVDAENEDLHNRICTLWTCSESEAEVSEHSSGVRVAL